VRAVVADDAALFREGLVRILKASGIDVVGEAGDKDTLIAAALAASPDVVVTDIRMPPTGTTEGLDAAAEIRQMQPAAPILVLSRYVETRHVARLLDDGGGGVGYLLKDR
jgi:DNA-binding NarL/FixJ family response regulator